MADILATLTSSTVREIGVEEAVDGTTVVIDHVERGVTIAPAEGVTVEIDVGLGVWRKIGEGAGEGE